MPSITFKLSDITYPKTAAAQPFKGFDNKEGYQTLAQGVGAVSAQLKDILIQRQTTINQVVQEEFNGESKRIIDAFMAEKKAEAEKAGVPFEGTLDGKFVEEARERVMSGTAAIRGKARGGFAQSLEDQTYQNVAKVTPELNLLERQTENKRIHYSVEKDVIAFIQKGDMKTAQEKLNYYVAIGAISEAEKARILADAPHTQSVYHAQQLQSVSPGMLYTALRENDQRLAGLKEDERETLLDTTKRQRANHQQVLARNIMESRYGVSSQTMKAYLDKAVADKDITQPQREAFEQERYGDFFGELWKEDPSAFDFLTPEEKARAEKGDMGVFDSFKDGGELIRRLTTMDNDDPTYRKTEAQIRMMLKLSGVKPGHVDYYLRNINIPKNKGDTALENTIWFRKYSEQFAQDTYLKADSPEVRAHGVKAYIEGLEDFHSRVKTTDPNALTPKEIERIYRECLAKVMGYAGEDGGGKGADPNRR